MRSAGVTPRRADESESEFLSREGANIMKAMRRCPAAPLDDESWDGDLYLIGGQCDLTIVAAEGATTRTVRSWPDNVGERINPFAEEPNVIPLNRQQGRARERELRELEKASA